MFPPKKERRMREWGTVLTEKAQEVGNEKVDWRRRKDGSEQKWCITPNFPPDVMA